eukprot:Hpha_TRINITY_DN15018_c5_g1::TRINITY_DN15018_c5_g1_i2::g.124734::m.124734
MKQEEGEGAEGVVKEEQHDGDVKPEEALSGRVKMEPGIEAEFSEEAPAKTAAQVEEEAAASKVVDGIGNDDRDVWDFGAVVNKFGGEADQGDKDFWEALKRQTAGDGVRDETNAPAAKESIDSITLSRSTHMIPHIYLPLFVDLCKGAFVRASVPQPEGKPRLYALYEVLEVKEGPIDKDGMRVVYQVVNKTETGTERLDTDWLLSCRVGRHVRDIRITSISDEKASEEEYIAFCKRNERATLPRITKVQCDRKRAQIGALYRKHYTGRKTEKQVEQTVQIRARLRGLASVNLVDNKIEIQEDLERMYLQHLELERKMRDTGGFCVPPEFEDEAQQNGAEAAYQLYRRHYEKRVTELRRHLDRVDNRMRMVLRGQNAAFETLAAITHRNAHANQGRLEAEDAADAEIFGRKLSRGKSCWVVSDAGWSEKEQAIKDYWAASDRKEIQNRELTELKRVKDRRKGAVDLREMLEAAGIRETDAGAAGAPSPQ